MSLPKLPGYSFNRNLGRVHFPRIQVLDKIKDTHYPYYDDKIFKTKPFQGSVIPGEYNGEYGPKWKVFNNKVLCFDGYWLEGLNESADETYRSRNCKVYFYLEDDTIQVLEPRIRNTGLAQGTIVNRRRVMKPPPNENFYITVDDLNIGEVLQFGGYHIKLTACDEFTSNMLKRFGKEVRHLIPEPRETVESMKQKLLSGKQGKGFHHKTNKLEQFLNHTRHVLRFYCFWNNEELVNDPRSLTLHYYLEDDTVEIFENLLRNSGRDSKVFLRRQRLPKLYKGAGLTFPNNMSDPGYLNVIRSSKDHKLIDSQNEGTKNIPFYKDQDFTIGQYVNVFGRLILICDCDKFTKEYYRVRYGLDIEHTIDMNQYFDTGKKVDLFIAPHNGWGEEEDSINNCKTIHITEVVKSYKQFLETKKKIDDSLLLTYMAKIEDPTNKFDSLRIFIINYFVETDQTVIKELSDEQLESNTIGFFNRGRIKKPKSYWRDVNAPEYYGSCDFYLGSIVHVKGLKLKIFLADAYTCSYMEKNANFHINSSINVILNKIRGILYHIKRDVEIFFRIEDTEKYGHITFQKLQKFADTYLKSVLNPQEIVTLARHYTDRTIKPEIEKEKRKAVIRQKLRIAGYEQYSDLKQQWYSWSFDSRHIDLEQAWSLLKGAKFPLSDELLCDALKLSQNNTTGLIDLCEFMEIIHWQRLHPDYYVQIGRWIDCPEFVSVVEKYEKAQHDPETTMDIGLIKYAPLLDDIFNPPKISMMHPSTQRMLHSRPCKETAY